jgi:CDP-diacylglycerol--serine O-phosphatidyltransferase
LPQKFASKNVLIIFPSTITSFSMICGLASVIMSLEQQLATAGLLVLIAAILDGLDGKVARMTNSASDFGIQYDSLSDLVAFGVAPAVLFYRYFIGSDNPFQLYYFLPVMFLLCGAIRLARFNITASIYGKRHFTGLPIPAAAAALVIWPPLTKWVETSGSPIGTWLEPLIHQVHTRQGHVSEFAVVLLLVLSLAMISNLKFDTFDTFWFHFYPKRWLNRVVFALFLATLLVHFVFFMFAITAYYLMAMFARGLYWSLQKRIRFHQQPSMYEPAMDDEMEESEGDRPT